ncbi:hypothetical protein MMC34_004217 [Xylographa carneopallida]|nr:hypothetical protein [Xylographa carneopallida]
MGTTEGLYFVQDKGSSGGYYLPTTVEIAGPTTVVATLEFENLPWDATVATLEPTTFTFTTTLLSGVEVLVVPDGTVQSQVQITGPITWIATLSAEYPIDTSIHTEPLPNVYTQTFILNEGTEVIDVPVWPQQTLSPVTMMGPETLVLTITHEYDEFVEAGSISGDPHCSASTTVSNPNRLVTYATFATILTAGETLVTSVPTLPNPGDGFVSTTFTGPTTVSITMVADLFDIDAALPYGSRVGQVCAGECGFCQIYFPTVFVYYWPVPSPNDACLGESESVAANVSLTVRDRIIVPRNLPGLAGFSGAGSTLVNSDGFTFTSPSAYIAFPTISAYDACGILGNIHTSVTLGVAPGDLSSIVFQEDAIGGTVAQSFNFADAHCPPSSLLNNNTYSIIGQTGYNPIIAPPAAALTNLDPAWGGLCFIAAFQGNDPPFALVPQSDLMPTITSVNPIIIATPASPSSAIPKLPQQTPAPTTMFTPQTATHLANDPPKSSIISADPVVAPSVLPPQQGASTIVADPQPPLSMSPTVVIGVSIVPTSLITVMVAPSPVSAYIIDSQTLVAGGPAITISNTLVSLAPSASYIMIGSTTQLLAAAPTPGPPQAILAQQLTAFGSTFTAKPESAFVIGTQTLKPGASITVSGTLISLAPSASYVVVGSNTQMLAEPEATPIQPLTAFGSTFTADSASAFVIGSQTLTPGGSITVSGTLFSLAPLGSYIVVGSSTQTLAAAPTSTLPKAAPITAPVEQLIAFDSTYTANVASAFIIGSQTLTPGGTITVSGTVLALPTGSMASYVLENGSTVPFALVTTLSSAVDPVVLGQTLTPLSAPGTTTQGLASLIMNPFGAGGTNTSASAVGTFKGVANGGFDALSLRVLIGCVLVAVAGSWAIVGRP